VAKSPLDRGLLPRITASGATTYSVRLRLNGRLKIVGSGFKTKTAARFLRDKVRAERHEGTYFPGRYQRSGRAAIALPEPILAGESARQKQFYTGELRFWRWWTQALKGKSKEQITQNLPDLLPAGIGPATKNRYLSYLHKTLKIPVPHFQEPKAPAYYYTREQEQALYRQMAPANRDICRLTLLCLLRQSELFTLRKEWIDWENRRILLPDPKAKEPQWIQLPHEGIRILRRVCARSPASALVMGDHWPKAYNWYRTIFVPARISAGLPPTLKFHTLRHTAPGRLAAAGVSNATVQALGRWKSHSVVARYTHHSQPDLKSAADKLT